MLTDNSSPADIGITRHDLEQTLDANGYYRGAADEDPDKDATHVWYSSDNRRFVKFRVPEEDGQVLYGDMGSEAYITYNNALLVLSGIMTLAEAKRSKFVLPANVAKKLHASRDAIAAAALPKNPDDATLALPGPDASSADLATYAKDDLAQAKKEPRYPDPATSGPAGDDAGVFTPVTGKDGVF